MAQIDIREENLWKLVKIQKVIREEEGISSSLDESLARVLDFYRKYVPYN
jgi:hypothetical protein